jgi:hypothetical protein
MSKASEPLTKEEIWNALVQTAHALLMYKHHKRYVEEVMLKERPDITPKELAIRLSIPLGEALVLLSETRNDTGQLKVPKETVSKGDDRSLLDYSG